LKNTKAARLVFALAFLCVGLISSLVSCVGIPKTEYLESIRIVFEGSQGEAWVNIVTEDGRDSDYGREFDKNLIHDLAAGPCPTRVAVPGELGYQAMSGKRVYMKVDSKRLDGPIVVLVYRPSGAEPRRFEVKSPSALGYAILSF
jgi:hypothetical protein